MKYNFCICHLKTALNIKYYEYFAKDTILNITRLFVVRWILNSLFNKLKG